MMSLFPASASISHALRALAVGAAAILALLVLGVGPARAATSSPGASYVVGTYDGKALTLYVDGKQVARQATSAPVKAGPAPVEIGSFLGREQWYGTIDEVALYARALDAATVLKHYRVGSGALRRDYGRTVRGTPGLAAYWQLSDPTLETAADVLRRHPGVYGVGTVLRVPALIANSTNQAAAFNGGTGDVVVHNADGLSLARGFTLEAWAAAGARRDQALLSKVDSWFIKTNFSGQWGVGFITSAKPRIVSIYGKVAAPVAPTPVALANQQATPPPASSPKASKKTSGNSLAIVTWIVIIVAVGGLWLIWRRRRGGASGGSEDDEAGERERPLEPDSGGGEGEDVLERPSVTVPDATGRGGGPAHEERGEPGESRES